MVSDCTYNLKSDLSLLGGFDHSALGATQKGTSFAKWLTEFETLGSKGLNFCLTSNWDYSNLFNSLKGSFYIMKNNVIFPCRHGRVVKGT